MLSTKRDSASKDPDAREDVWLETSCYGCPAATCGMLARRVNGVVVEVAGDPASLYSSGRMCAKGQAQIMMAYSTRRVTKPLKRTNPEKGIGVDPKWVEISYEEAIRIAATELKRFRDTNPAGLVFSTADFSTLTWFTGALLGSFGSPNLASGGNVFCGNNVHPVLQQVHGGFHVQSDLHYCNYLMLLGSNKGAVSNWAAVSATIKLADTRRRGMKLVVVDPWCSNAAAIADEWLPIRPGTDGAFVLAMLHVLVNELGLFDCDFVARLTNGPYLVRDDDGRCARDPATNKLLIRDRRDQVPKCYDDPGLGEPAIEGSGDAFGIACRPAFEKLKEHLAKYPPERTEEITTIPAATIRRIAREFGTAASIGSTIEIEGQTLPLRPACAHWYEGVSQHARGYEQGVAIAMLNTLVGAVDVPGGLLSDAVYVHHPKYSAHSTWLGKGSSLGDYEGLLMPGNVATYGGMFAPPYPLRAVKAPAGFGDDTDGFRFRGVTYKWPFLTGTFSQFNPWLSELSRTHPYAARIAINRRVARSLGIGDEDRVRVENRNGGRVEGVAKLSDCIHPECLGMDHAGGHWARSQSHAKNGVHYGTLLECDMNNIDNMNGALSASPKLRIQRIETPPSERPRRRLSLWR